LRAARTIQATHGWKVRVVDLRWLLPLNEAAIVRHASQCTRILVVDEGRRSAGVGEGILTAIAEGACGARPLRRVVGADTFTPLAGAAFLVIPSEADIVAAAVARAADPDRVSLGTDGVSAQGRRTEAAAGKPRLGHKTVSSPRRAASPPAPRCRPLSRHGQADGLSPPVSPP